MLRRTNPALRFVDLGGPVDEIDLDYDDDEKSDLRQHITANPAMSDEEKAEALAALGDDPEPVEPGKDVPDATPTDSTSLPPV